MSARGTVRKAGLALAIPATALVVVAGVRALAGGPVRAAGPSVVSSEDGRPSVSLPVTSNERACHRHPALIGTLVLPAVTARAAPRADAAPLATFTRRTVQGGPQVFVLRRPVRGPWVRAFLPVRPNGSMGYLPASALRLSSTRYRVAVDRAAFRLRLWRGCRLSGSYPVGIGRERTPTPAGRFYLTSLIRPRVRGSVYGPYAYGLSGFSDAIRSWRWGGVIGLHGTNDPSSIGRAASHGCIRMRNADILRLVGILPLGTPVTIR